MEHAGTSGNELFSDLAGDHDFHPSRRDAGSLAAALKRRHADRIVAELVVPARAARHAGFPPGLDPCLVGALRERGILQPYSHQRECWDHVAAGRDVVVVIPGIMGSELVDAEGRPVWAVRAGALMPWLPFRRRGLRCVCPRYRPRSLPGCRSRGRS